MITINPKDCGSVWYRIRNEITNRITQIKYYYCVHSKFRRGEVSGLRRHTWEQNDND